MVTFGHVCHQTQYITHLSGFLAGGNDLIQAEFIIEDDAVLKTGLYLEIE